MLTHLRRSPNPTEITTAQGLIQFWMHVQARAHTLGGPL